MHVLAWLNRIVLCCKLFDLTNLKISGTIKVSRSSKISLDFKSKAIKFE
jgi:hypothetical protein